STGWPRPRAARLTAGTDGAARSRTLPVGADWRPSGACAGGSTAVVGCCAECDDCGGDGGGDCSGDGCRACCATDDGAAVVGEAPSLYGCMMMRRCWST